jgi:hypothetical protein
MKSIYRTTAIITLAAFVSACASKGADVTASHVPSSRYATADCERLTRDLLDARTARDSMSAQLDSAAQKDAGLVAVSIILFWPAAFFVGQDKGKEAELARLKGEVIALERALDDKRCPR